MWTTSFAPLVAALTLLSLARLTADAAATQAPADSDLGAKLRQLAATAPGRAGVSVVHIESGRGAGERIIGG